MPLVQDALEKGYFRGTWARALGSGWGHFAATRVARPLTFPAGVRSITIGGATLGGSGKTPVAIAWARREADRGETVMLIGHAYGANPKRARVVRLDDDVRVVGDEALVAAQELAGVVDVVVAPTRQAAIDFAIERGARCLVVDGVLQTSPRPSTLSVLVVDAAATCSPACPPAGDLRAPLSALRACSDLTIELGDDDKAILAGAHRARVVSEAVRAPDGSLVTYETLACQRVGLALAVAHPERIVARLARRGVFPVACAYVGDHMGAQLRRVMQRISRDCTDIDAWVTSAKCAAFVAPSPDEAIPIHVILHRVLLPSALP